MENRLDETERRLRNSEEDLRSYKIEKGISLLTEETSQIIEQSAELEMLLSEAETELAVAENRLKYLTQELSDQDEMLGDVNSILNTPLLDELRKEIVTNQSKYLRLLSKPEYSPDHPELVSLSNQIESAKKQLNEEIQKATQVKAGTSDPLVYRSELISNISKARIDKNIAESKVETLLKSVENYNKRLSLLPDAEIELARLERNYRINEKTYSMLNEKFEEARIAEKSKMGKIRIVEEAQTPSIPIKPNKMMNFLIAVVLGLGIGIGTAFLLHSLDSKIRTFDDVRNYVSLPILGTIPYITVHNTDLDYLEKQIKNAEGEEKEELEKVKQQVEARLITNYAPKSSTSESFRMLRTNIVAKKEKDRPLSILVTSSGPKEGKSTIISNLSIALSQMGKKVVLIDLDLRRPVQHKIFKLDKNEGISDYLYDHEKEISFYIKKSNINNLDIITSGFIPPNPSELLSSSYLDEALEYLETKYDYILIDSPPIMAVTDSIILAKKVDVRVLVVRINQANKVVIKRIKEILDNVDSDFTGAIINGINPQKYYSSYEYNYYYYYYYGKEDEKTDGVLPKKSRQDKSVS
ncbi:MAG: polysaccharide biosynthesis tyrosine autokinase [Candidatus Cloacimonadota bacterium]|nr:polysaccharide biosynthesis tyrosine autokinase [Candidatus Cloacimonadota bacterium]